MTKVFAIFDNKAEAFMQPFFATTIGLALRTFQQHVQNPDTIFHQNPNDFVIYEIGTFDDQTGELVNYEQNKNLGMAIDFYEKKLEAVK